MSATSAGVYTSGVGTASNGSGGGSDTAGWGVVGSDAQLLSAVDGALAEVPIELVLKLLRGALDQLPTQDYGRIEYVLEQLLKHSESEQGRALISDSDAEAYAIKLEVLHLLKSLDLALRAPLAPQAGGEVGTAGVAPPAPPGSEREAISRRIPFHDLVKSPRSTLDAVVTPSNVHKVIFSQWGAGGGGRGAARPFIMPAIAAAIDRTVPRYPFRLRCAPSPPSPPHARSLCSAGRSDCAVVSRTRS